MKWLTLSWIKSHSRIDYDCEDDLLELYGKSAEDIVLKVCNRTYNDLLECYGEVPNPIFQASLMLVDLSYQQRSAMSMQNLYLVPYTFDFLIKPYIRLSNKCYE